MLQIILTTLALQASNGVMLAHFFIYSSNQDLEVSRVCLLHMWVAYPVALPMPAPLTAFDTDMGIA